MRQTVAVGVIKATTPRWPRASRPKLLTRLSRRNEMLSWGNLHMGTKLHRFKTFSCKCVLHSINPGARNFGSFQAFGGFLRLAFTSIERSFAEYPTLCLLVAPSLIRPLLFCIIRPSCFRKQFVRQALLGSFLYSATSLPCV